MIEYYASCNKFTILVVTKNGCITNQSAPIIRKFVGQEVTSLWRWMKGFGGFRKKRLH